MSAPRRCVVSSGFGAWYPRGVDRLRASLAETNPGLAAILFRDSETHARMHARAAYSFKFDAIEAARAAGFDSVLWLDASVWAVSDLSPVFELLESRGVYLVEDGWRFGQWCSDAALGVFSSVCPGGLSRDRALEIPNLWACMLGVCPGSPAGSAFLREVWGFIDARPGVFNGPANNTDGSASSDPRVLGHRYDQTVCEFVSWRLGLPRVPLALSHLALADDPRVTPLRARGL